MPPSRKPLDVSAASKERNEYIPSFIAKKPFYVDDDSSTTDYLEHQRLQKAPGDGAKWYDRRKQVGPVATKFRKGACENCGSMTHKTKECLSRPRKLGARWTGQDIQADEVVQDVRLGWDAKRDRWNGYDAAAYSAVVAENQMMEELRRQTKGEKGEDRKAGENGAAGGGEEGDDNDDEDEEAKYAEESDMGRQQSKATRNLRLREDTAKYLLNLDLDSAKYDPKTRTMVDSGATVDQAAALVAEENFMRASGDAAEFERAQRLAWESQERGDKNRQHVQANPTSGEFFRRQAQAEAEARKEAQRRALLEKYGDQQASTKLPPGAAAAATAAAAALLTESERYVEYDERGLVKGAPWVAVKSKYAEDVLINNHTAVWGSWWADFRWGYACCHSTVKNSYCTGEQGKVAFEEAERFKEGGALQAPTAGDGGAEGLPTRSEGGGGGGGDGLPTKEDGGGGIANKDDGAIANGDAGGLGNGDDGAIEGAALRRNVDRRGHDGGKDKLRESTPQRKPQKRTLEEMKGGVTEDELEAYRRKRTVADDPMAAFLGKDELVH